MFKINGITWQLKFVRPYDEMLRRDDGTLSIGMCDNELKMIFINENLRGQMLRRVLCHELTHAAMFSYDVSLTDEQEELLADLIATYGEEIIQITNQLFGKIKMRDYIK